MDKPELEYVLKLEARVSSLESQCAKLESENFKLTKEVDKWVANCNSQIKRIQELHQTMEQLSRM